MKKYKNNYLLLLLVGVLFLGIGYAAVSNITLNINGSATANGTATNEDFKVRFVKFDSSDDIYVSNASTNAAVVKTTNGIDAANVSLDVTADDKAQFSISEGFDEVGDFVTLEYNVVNESEGLPAYIYVDVENESNTASDYFVITKTIEDNELSEGEVTKVIVKVELIARPKLDIDASFTVKLKASANEENTESSQTGGGTSAVTSAGTKVAAQAGETHKGIVYIDPSDLTVECDQNSEITTTPTGCKKFYIFDDSNDKYTMIMDRNTTYMLAWNSSSNNADGMNEAATALHADTEGWVGNPRLITAEEVAHIVGADSEDTIKWSIDKPIVKFNPLLDDAPVVDPSANSSWFYLDGSGTTYSSSDGWQKRVANETTPSNYSWLFDYTEECKERGCSVSDFETSGYWTESITTGTDYAAWYVDYAGSLKHQSVSVDYMSGIRPVITLDKAIVD